MNYGNYYFQDEKVKLRPWEPMDYDDAYEMEYDSECMALIREEVVLPGKRITVDPEGDSAEIDLKAPAFSIIDNEGNYVGYIHFNYINERHGTFSIGLAIKRVDRIQGYGKAALTLLVKYAFEERRLHKFTAYCLDNNQIAMKLLESIGCRREGVDRESVFMYGRYHDRFLYGMTADEYATLYTTDEFLK